MSTKVLFFHVGLSLDELLLNVPEVSLVYLELSSPYKYFNYILLCMKIGK